MRKREEKYEQAKVLLRRLYDEKSLELSMKQEIYTQYLKLIRELAYSNVADAQYKLAFHYEDVGYWGVPNPYHNIRRKFYWYSKAAENNHAEACNNLANMYENGQGCEKDIDKPLYLYKKSGDLGDIWGKKNYNLLRKQLKQASSEKNIIDKEKV